MNKFYQIILGAVCLLLTTQVIAQRTVLIQTSGDPGAPTDITAAIMGDTMSNGDRVDNNTIYQLENGGVYVTTSQIVNKPEWKLHIEAEDLDNTDLKPVITRIPNNSGTFPNVFWPEGDMTLKNIWVILGEKDAGAQHDWGKLRIFGENSRVIVEDCIIEKDRGGFLQIRANGVKLYVTNSILRNGGNRKILQGNGRGIDARDFAMDSVVVRNTIIHNIQDRVFRSQGGTAPHNYVEFDHCTVFNQIGRHGCFQFGKVLNVKITNNLLINPLMLGTSPAYTDEQTQPDNDAHKIFTADTLYSGASFEFASNNIFYTQDVIDFFNSVDSVSKPEIYSQIIATELGNDAPNTYFEEVLTLASVPMSILEYVEDLYADPAATDMFDFIVEDISVQGTDFDFGNLFDFATFDPCYPETAESATAGTDGGAIGATAFCEGLQTNVFTPNIANELALKVMPNPVRTEAIFNYNLAESGAVTLIVYDMMGRVVSNVVNADQVAGEYQVTWSPNGQLANGLYLARLQTVQGEMSFKFFIQ